MSAEDEDGFVLRRSHGKFIQAKHGVVVVRGLVEYTFPCRAPATPALYEANLLQYLSR